MDKKLDLKTKVDKKNHLQADFEAEKKATN